MKKLLTTITLLTLLTTLSYAGKEDIGTKTMQFLKIGVGARGTAMGGAQGAISQDVNSLYWNPAGLAEIENQEASFMHCEWLEGIKYEELAYAKKAEKVNGTLGVMVTLLGTDDILKMDKDGVLTGETYKGNDLALILGYARKIEKLNVGANLKYLRSKLEEESATSLAIDLGAQYKLKEETLICAIVLQNIGTKAKFIKESESIPTNIKIGLGSKLELFENECVLALDINSPNDEEIKVNFGAEYNYKLKRVTISPRLGYRTDKSDLEEGSNAISAGFGLTVKKTNIDYAYAPYGELGSTHKISIKTKFGK